MLDLVLIGQGLVDYFCEENGGIIKKFGGVYKKCRVPFKKIDRIITESKIMHRNIGGCVTNTAVGLNKLNRKCYLVFCVGGDKKGTYFMNNIKKYKNIVPIVKKCTLNTGVVLTFIKKVDKRDNHLSLYNHGAANNLELTNKLKKMLPRSLLYISLFSFSEKKYSNLFNIMEYAKRNKATIILDAGGIAMISQRRLKKIIQISSGIIANEKEFGYLKKIKSELAGKWVIIKRGEKPVEFYMNNKLTLRVHIKKSKEFVNSLGAGDAFAAGFIDKFSKGKSFGVAIKNGNTCAAHIVKKISANYVSR